jgi:hypothetical protein
MAHVSFLNAHRGKNKLDACRLRSTRKAQDKKLRLSLEYRTQAVLKATATDAR